MHLRKDTGVHMGLQKGALRSTLRTTGQVSGIHTQIARDILWLLQFLQGLHQDFYAIITGNFSPEESKVLQSAIIFFIIT